MMIQDDEYEVLVTTPERIEVLGFKPQKEILTNHILPYAEELDEESTIFLKQVKTNLAKAVVLREIKPACGVWSSRLMKYIRIYGLKFGKEDHIALIKLAYELVIIPELEPCKVHKFITMFLMLTKKRHLITPEDLTLPWRPLYDVGKKMFETSATQIGMYHYIQEKDTKSREDIIMNMVRKFVSGHGLDDAISLFGFAAPDENELPTSLESSFISMIKCAKPYFAVTATKEILAEILPQIYLWSNDPHTIGQLTVFLPVGLHPKYAEHGHRLWFDQMMTLWDTCYNAQCGISDLMNLFAGLAKRNPGAVDWSPYAATMFSRFLHALNLPVSYKDMQYSRNHSLDMKHVASWIVWAIAPDGKVMKQLRTFLGAVESYLHSANSGRWSFKLRDLLRKLAREFLNRVRREREKRFQENWENQTPESHRLRDSDITEFVNILLEPTLQAVYSRSGSLDISMALQNLATLRPAAVVPPLVDKLRTALTSLTEPHRVTAAMSAVAAVARPLLRGPESDYPEGPTHVVPLLLAVLPGLDPNDIKKSIVTLHFILIFSWMVPFIDCSSAYEYHSDLTEEELLTCESTAQFEDFVLVFFDRIFTIIESSILEHARLDTKESDTVRSKTDAVMETAISSATTAVLMQCSSKIFREALRKFRNFATETTFETNVSGSIVGVLLKVFARVNAEATLAAFMPDLCDELIDLLATDEALREENPPRDLLYRLVLFKHVVECDGTVLLKYMDKILPVLDRALKLHSNYALIRACDALSHIFNSLSFIDLKEWRSCPRDYGEAPEKWLPIREWGRGCLLKEANFSWHVPNEDEAKCAQMLVERYLMPEVQRLRQWLSGERAMGKERRLRSLHIINAVLACSTFLPPPNEEPVALLDSLVPATRMPFTNGVRHEVTLEGNNMRVALTHLLCDVQSKLLEERTDDTRGLEMLIQVWERVVVMKGLRTGPGLEARLRSYAALERALDGRGSMGGTSATPAKLRMLLADAARLQDESRLDLVCDAGITPSALKALHALYDLAINTYSSVRIYAQIRLCWMLSHYPYSYRALLPRLYQLLSQGGEGDEWHAKHKGALFMMLAPRNGPLIAKQDWEVVKTLWPAILKAPLSEKPSILKLEQAFSDSIHRNFPTINTRLTISDAAVKSAMYFFTEEQLKQPSFAELIATARERERAVSDRTERMYVQLVEEIVDIAETPNLQWRRLELAMQMLTFCPSLQTPYPPKAVRLMVNSLIHDNITVRKTAHRLTHYALKQRKRPLKKILVDPYEVAGVKRPEKFIPGYRKDLMWAIYSEERIPKTDEDWDRPWLRNLGYGFYSWPEKLVVAAPSSEQFNPSELQPEQMEEGERHLFEFFNDEDKINKLVSFLTVEEKKGRDKFNGTRFTVLRMAFAHFGMRIASRLLDHALKCASDSQEAPQRFASEVTAAALRAPRYWRRKDAMMMYERAMEVLKAGVSRVTAETWEDWGTSVATGCEKLDPTRAGVILTELVRLCAPSLGKESEMEQDASFLVCARLYALQGALGSLTWRAAPLAKQLLQRLEAANFTQHPYQNVRETVGSILMTVFDTEVNFLGSDSDVAPVLSDFLASVKPRLAPLYDEKGEMIIKLSASPTPGPCVGRDDGAAGGPDPELCRPLVGQVGDAASVAEDALATKHDDGPQQATEPNFFSTSNPSRCGRESAQLVSRLATSLRLSSDAAATNAKDHDNAVNLLTTALRVCTGVVVRCCGGGGASLQLARAACGAARPGRSAGDELPRAAAAALATRALAPTPAGPALDTLEDLASSGSWWARLSCLEFAQPLLFYCLPMLSESVELAQRAENLALTLMKDSRLEVRVAAGALLTGLMHCRVLPDEDATLRRLLRQCRRRAPLERHAGVLGLCAHLAARPYSLPPALGVVLQELSRHSHAPDPIPASIRAALADFRRTHSDDWARHRERLSAAELDLLADLTAPPSYCT